MTCSSRAQIRAPISICDSRTSCTEIESDCFLLLVLFGRRNDDKSKQRAERYTNSPNIGSWKLLKHAAPTFIQVLSRRFRLYCGFTKVMMNPR